MVTLRMRSTLTVCVDELTFGSAAFGVLVCSGRSQELLWLFHLKRSLPVSEATTFISVLNFLSCCELGKATANLRVSHRPLHFVGLQYRLLLVYLRALLARHLIRLSSLGNLSVKLSF